MNYMFQPLMFSDHCRIPSRAIFLTLLTTVLVSIFKVSSCSTDPKIITNSNPILRDPLIQLQERSRVYLPAPKSAILAGLTGALAHPLAHPVSPRVSVDGKLMIKGSIHYYYPRNMMHAQQWQVHLWVWHRLSWLGEWHFRITCFLSNIP